jgi:hypothetical protein
MEAAEIDEMRPGKDLVWKINQEKLPTFASRSNKYLFYVCQKKVR